MFSAVEGTGSYKMWSQVLPAVSRGIHSGLSVLRSVSVSIFIFDGETRWSELAVFVGQERVKKQHKNISLRGMYSQMAVLM